MRGRDLGGTVAEAQERIVKERAAAQREDLERAQKRLEVIITISLALIFVLLYALFNSLRDTACWRSREYRLRSPAAF